MHRWFEGFSAGCAAEPGPPPVIRERFSMEAFAMGGFQGGLQSLKVVHGWLSSCAKKPVDDAPELEIPSSPEVSAFDSVIGQMEGSPKAQKAQAMQME
jgi:hypothetical protein